MKKLFFIILLFPMISCASTTKTKIEVQGHRGARAVLPENTLKAMDYALNVGVDTLELDLSVTKDDVLVLSHDPTLSKTLCLGPAGKKLTKEVIIRNITYKELQKYNCAALKNPHFPKQKPDKTQKIPTLEEVFRLVKESKHPAAKKVGFNIETKMIPGRPDISPSPKKFAQLIIDEAKKHDLLERVVIQSFDHRSLKVAKQIEPKVRVAALTNGTNPINLVEVIQAIPAEIWSPNQYWVTKELVEEMHRNNIRVIPWTANTTEEWQVLLDKNVDGIISDDPKALIQFLKNR